MLHVFASFEIKRYSSIPSPEGFLIEPFFFFHHSAQYLCEVFHFTTHLRASADDYALSVLIPTWNNLPYLQNCLRSLRLHTSLKLQIIVAVNEGRDGTLEWMAEQNDLDWVHCEENAGVCYALNACRSLVRAPWMVYMNDDMYALPDWDIQLFNAAERVGHHWVYLSATMIEPHASGNACVHVAHFGDSLANFQEDQLLQAHRSLQLNDWRGSTWPPSMLHRDLWDLVGGMSPEFHPGMYSDPDLSMKLYRAGVRHFYGIGSSRVYHFGSKSTRRAKKNPGRKRFLTKWGMSSRSFTKHLLQMGREGLHPLPAQAALPSKERLANRWKHLWAILKREHY